MSDHSQSAVDRLEKARRVRDRNRLSIRCATAGATFLAALILLALIDYWLMLPLVVRFAGAGVLVLLGGWGFAGLLHLWRHASSLKQVALGIEARRPELGCVVSTASEYLTGERTVTQSYEPELVDALEEQAAKALEREEPPTDRRLVWTMVCLAASTLAFVLFMGLTPASGTALKRILVPWLRATYTTVQVKPGSAEVPVGRDQEIVGAFFGRVPKSPRLLWRNEGTADWQSATLTNNGSNGWSYLLPKLRADVHYRVTGGDAASDEFKLSAYVPPKIQDLRIGVLYPEYTKLKPVEETTPNLSVLRGSRLTYRVTASRPICRAQLRFNTLPTMEMAVGASNLWTGSLQAAKGAQYTVELLDLVGRRGGNEEPYHLVVLPDEPPNVVITDPDMDIRAEANAKVPVKISATDDYGVEEIRLYFHKIGAPEQMVVCRKVSAVNGLEATATAEIDLAALQLKDYELAAYHAEASDNNTLDGPGVGKSRVHFIEVTSKEKALSQCSGGNGQKINILQLEKQLIAATSEEKSEGKHPERLLDLAAAQRQAQQYAELFQNSPVLSAAPPEAQREFAEAIDAMEKAAGALDATKAAPALQSEEEALAHLYQVARLLPEFESMCKGGANCPKIVLEAIEKLKKDQKDKLLQDLPKILAESKRVAGEQAELNSLYLQPRPEGERAKPSETDKKGQSPGAPKPNKAANGGAQAPNQAEAQAPGKDGKDYAQEQRKLGEEAKALVAKLRELANKDPRVGHRYSENMGQVADNMGLAASSVSRGNFTSAGAYGNSSWHGLSQIITGLERLLQTELPPKGADVAAEDYPKAFEGPISEYLRKLSYEE
jgi:hypothetical protein